MMMTGHKVAEYLGILNFGILFVEHIYRFFRFFCEYPEQAYYGHIAEKQQSWFRMAGGFVWNILDDGVFKERKDIYCPGVAIPLTNITEMPIHLFAGGNDPLAPYGNSVRLC